MPHAQRQGTDDGPKAYGTQQASPRAALWASAGVLLGYALLPQVTGQLSARLAGECLLFVMVALPLCQNAQAAPARATRQSLGAALCCGLWVLPPFWLGYVWWLAPPGAFWPHLLGPFLRLAHSRAQDGPAIIANLRLLAWAVWHNALGTALPEEMFWRGYVQRALTRGGHRAGGLLLANALFAVSHVVGGGAWLRLSTFFPGLLFGWLALRCNGVAGAWLLHTACNVTALWTEIAWRQTPL